MGTTNGGIIMLGLFKRLKARRIRTDSPRKKLERIRRKLENQDYLLSQIDEFREKAMQLQELLVSRESKAKELQTIVEEREVKAEELQHILDERQEKADGITAEVSKKINVLIEKVAQKMDEVEASMKAELANGNELSAQQAQQLKDTLTEVTAQLETIKGELSEKIHSENVICYRNMADLMKGIEDKLDDFAVLQDTVDTNKKLSILGIVLGGVNLIALIALILVSFGII